MKTNSTFSIKPLVLIFLFLLPLFSYSQLRKPLVSSETLRNYCPANTSNLNYVLLSTPGSGQSIRWYSSPTRTGGVYASHATAANGTYYAFLYDTLSNSYSEASRPVQVTNTACNTAVTSSTMSCNQLVPVTKKQFSGLTSSIVENNPVTCLLSGVGDVANNMIDTSHSNSSSYIFGLSVLCKSTFRVASTSDTFGAGSFAGFKVSTAGLLGTNVGYKVTVSIYNDLSASPVQEKVVLSDTASLNPLQIGADGNAILGFIAEHDFDEIRISFESIISAAFTARVHYAVVGKYCEGPDLVANTITPINNNVFPTRINTERAGLLCVGCSISNVENVISPSKSDFATITTAVGLGNKSSLSVQDVITNYPPGTFAGFVIQKPSILNLELLNGITLTAFRDGIAVDTVSGGALISLGSSLLSGEGKHLLGFMPDDEFDEIQITIEGLVASLGSVRVYEAVLQRFEDGDLEDCNTITSLINPDFPMAINPERTKMTGTGLGACVGCAVNNEQNVINEHTDDYATINMGVTVLDLKGSFSVKSQTSEFPQGTFAGFEIENNTVLDLSILESISIKVYRNNVVVDTSTGSTQLLSLNLLGSSLSGKNIIGFVPNQPFDEIVLEVKNSPLVSVGLGETRVYRAVASQFCSPTLECDSSYSLSLPDFPVMLNHERTGYTGLVCGLTNISNAMGVISGEANNPATITLPVSVGCEGAISVKSYETLFPAGSRAGFIIKTENDFLQLDLLPSITIQTYRNDTLVNNLTLSSLLNIELLGIISNERTYRVFLRATEPFDEVRIAMSSLGSVLNPVSVYNSFVDTRGAFGGGLDCCSLDGFVPLVSVSNESNSCPAETVNLTDNLSSACPDESELQWHNVASGFSGASVVTNSLATVSGQYYAVCFDSLANCYSSASSPVTVDIVDCCPVITNNTAGNSDPAICGGNNGQITICGLRTSYAGYEVRYVRNGGAEVVVSSLTSNASGCIILSNLLAGTYSIRVYHADCTTGSNSLTIVLDNPPVPSAPTGVSVSSTSVCLGQTVTLSATCASGTLAWYSNPGLTIAVTSPVAVTANSTYYAVCESGTCKSASGSVSVNVIPVLPIPIGVTASSTSVCVGQTVTLSATCTSGTLAWYSDLGLTVSVANSVIVNTNTTYFAVCESGICKSIAGSVSVNVIPTPPAPTGVSASSTSVCSGQTVTLSANCASGTLAWYSNSGLTSAVTSPVTVNSNTTYYAVCESGLCRGASGSVSVNVEQTPTSPLNLVANANDVCDDFSTSLVAECSSGTVKWYTDNTLSTPALADFTPLTQVTYYAVCELGSCKSPAQSLIVNPNTTWLNGDCDGDGVTNQNEIISSGISDPVTDFKDPCDYNEAEQNILNVSQAWKDLDCDRDGNPNDPDPHPKVPTALNDILTAPYGTTSTVNIMANDDFLPGVNTSLSRVAGSTGGTASGTVSFAPLTGLMQYSPAITEGGTTQTLVYQVCNIAVTPQVCTTATVTITIPPIVIDTCKPDFNPSISVIPSNGISGQQDMLVTLNIKEIANCAANAIESPIKVVLPKVAQFSFDWASLASAISLPGTTVTGLKNEDWDFTEDTAYWIWTYNKAEFGPLQISRLGIKGIWNSGSTGGKVNFSVTLVSDSENGIDIGNNLDQEVVNFNAINP
jgi:hypothetical protein